jgi:hypothetical protein
LFDNPSAAEAGGAKLGRREHRNAAQGVSVRPRPGRAQRLARPLGDR